MKDLDENDDFPSKNTKGDINYDENNEAEDIEEDGMAEDDEEEEDEEEDEETEPQLKYQRLVGSLNKIFSSNNTVNHATALVAGDKFVVLS